MPASGLPTMPPWHVQENKWRAARYGLDAVIILDADSNERLVTEDLDDLLNRLEPVAKSLNCADELARVSDIYRSGASYQRQRRVAERKRRRPACGGRRAGRRVGHLGVPSRRCSRWRWRCCPARSCRCGSSSRAMRRWLRLPALAADDDPAFGVVLIAAGREVGGGDTRSDVGALAHITECADFGDGRYRLRCVMAERIRVLEWHPDDPYPRAAVEVWPDEPGAAVDVDAIRDVEDRMVALFERIATRTRRTR